MRLRDILALVLVVAAPFAALYGLAQIARWRAGRRDPISSLIKPPKALAGMESVDWSKTDRAGEVRWQEVLEGQEVLRDQRKTRKNVIPMRKVG